MSEFIYRPEIRWADLDPNFHVRHSVYYDWGASCRVEFLKSQQVTTALMKELLFGPILFREEAIFRKEIHSGDHLTMNLTLLSSRRDGSRWSFRHRIMKQGEILCATLTVDGAWLDMRNRKLFAPPQIVLDMFEHTPTDPEFSWQEG